MVVRREVTPSELVPSVSRMRLEQQDLTVVISKRGLQGSREAAARGEGHVRIFINMFEFSLTWFDAHRYSEFLKLLHGHFD